MNNKINLAEFEDLDHFNDDNAPMKTLRPRGFNVSRTQRVREAARKLRKEILTERRLDKIALTEEGGNDEES